MFYYYCYYYYRNIIVIIITITIIKYACVSGVNAGVRLGVIVGVKRHEFVKRTVFPSSFTLYLVVLAVTTITILSHIVPHVPGGVGKAI